MNFGPMKEDGGFVYFVTRSFPVDMCPARANFPRSRFDQSNSRRKRNNPMCQMTLDNNKRRKVPRTFLVQRVVGLCLGFWSLLALHFAVAALLYSHGW